MMRHGFLKQEILFVLVILAVLCGLVVMMTFRSATADEGYRPDDLQIIKNEHVARDMHFAEQQKAPPGQDIPPAEQKEVTTPEGLKYTDQKIGEGERAKIGSQLLVKYVGKFTNGEVFDTNMKKAPIPLTIGNKEVIRGWEIGLIGMKTGGKRLLKIPHALGYGDSGSPPRIPPKTDLVFEIEVVKVINR
jgi:FKBP-type peptidyl-prolyl cis-trans isomerase